MKLCVLLLTLELCGWYMVLTAGITPQWTWLHKHTFSPSQVNDGDIYGMISITTLSIPFNHLIFSWNAFRPQRGYFSFWIEVRDALTKRWYTCHKVAEWGAGVQRSFLSTSKEGSSYFHVRLELPSLSLADAFRVHIKRHEQASLTCIKHIFVNTVHTQLFKSESVHDLVSLPNIYIRKVPQQSQMVLNHPRAQHLCSPTSTALLTSYVIKRWIDPLQFARHSYDPGLDAYGSWPFNTAHAFECARGKVLFYVKRLASFKELHRFLMRQQPVVVSVRGPLTGAAGSYAQGHLLMVVGYSQVERKVYCHDPAFETTGKTCVAYELKNFLEAWERSRRLAYIAERA